MAQAFIKALIDLFFRGKTAVLIHLTIMQFHR
jgi:hypothetical protein